LKKIHLLFLLIAAWAVSNAQNVGATSYITYLGKTEKGTIYVSSCGYDKKEMATYLTAVRNAFETIMFRGVPGSEIDQPLVDDEKQAKEKYRKYFDDFYADEYYKKFITYIQETKPTKEFKSKKACLQMKINYMALKKDLERNEIIRKFGY